jgi:hypothetical protein
VPVPEVLALALLVELPFAPALALPGLLPPVELPLELLEALAEPLGPDEAALDWLPLLLEAWLAAEAGGLVMQAATRMTDAASAERAITGAGVTRLRLTELGLAMLGMMSISVNGLAEEGHSPDGERALRGGAGYGRSASQRYCHFRTTPFSRFHSTTMQLVPSSVWVVVTVTPWSPSPFAHAEARLWLLVAASSVGADWPGQIGLEGAVLAKAAEAESRMPVTRPLDSVVASLLEGEMHMMEAP